MPSHSLTPDARRQLGLVSVATLTTCLFKRGFRSQLVQDVKPIAGGPVRLVGEAFTVRTIPAREDLATTALLADRAYPQRAAIEACPAGHVLVIDSRRDARAASGGDILMTRLHVRGAAGCVTDGGMRDCAEIAAIGLPVYQVKPSAPISLLHHLSVDMNVPIACGGAPVFPGDIIVGDAEAVIVLPAHLANEVAAEAFEMTAYDDFAVEEVCKGAPMFDVYPANEASRARFAIWRSANGR